MNSPFHGSPLNASPVRTAQPAHRRGVLRRRRLGYTAVLLALSGWSCSESDPGGTDSSTGDMGGTTTNMTSATSGTSSTSTSTASNGMTSNSSSVTTGASSVTTGVGGAATTGSDVTAVTGVGGVTATTDGVTTSSGGMGTGVGGVDGTSTDTTGTTTGGTGGTGSEVDAVCPFSATAQASGSNWVNGEMLEFNDNGGWCWYQDERVLVDTDTGKLIIGSVASGGSRDKNVEVVHWDIASKQGERFHIGTMSYTDDHDAPGIVKRPDGGYAAMWAGHNDDCNSYFSVFNGTSWSASKSFAWPSSGCPTSSGKRITYANMWYIGDTLYSYVRSLETSPHYLYSEDDGNSWQLGGRLTATPQVGYVAGYYKYWGNNTDRIDFFGTEAHPRDNDNSLYHGYIQGGKIYNSTGQVIDDDFTDTAAKDVPEYTKVFATGTTINGVKLEHMWNADVVRYADGTVAAIGSGRVSGTGSDDPDKRLLYFRFDGTEWKTTYLAKAGTKLYSSEQDYTGLGALDPDNPHIIYISTAYNPTTDEGTFTGKKEIWKGVTCDNGATFTWEPVTANSTMDNLRPIVPKWDTTHTALLWLRGTYSSAQSYNQQIVGLIEEN